MKFTFVFLILFCTDLWAQWSVSTFNIRNFDHDPGAGKTDLRELAVILKNFKSDVMAFEEVVNLVAFKILVQKNFPGYKYVVSSCGGFGRQYLAVVYNPATFDFVSSAEDMNFTGSRDRRCGSLRPLLLVNLRQKASAQVFTFGVAHLKAGSDTRARSQRLGQYQLLRNLAAKYNSKNLILLGDFNTTGYNSKDDDYVGFAGFLNSSKMRSMSESLGCTNYWEGTLGGREHQPSTLDHIILQSKALKAVQGSRVGTFCEKFRCRPELPEVLGKSYLGVSDHCPLQVIFK